MKKDSEKTGLVVEWGGSRWLRLSIFGSSYMVVTW